MSHPILTDSDIPITTSSGVHGPPIAEWTLMNWLVASRQYARFYEAQKEKRWDTGNPLMTTIHDQVGKNVGILGYGSIGRQSMYNPQYRVQRSHKSLPVSFYKVRR